MIKILLVAGARPNFMKIMPLIREFRKHPRRIKFTLMHTGQHYDESMSAKFFRDLDIPAPDIYLGVGSGTHGVQTAKIIEGVERVLLKKRFDLVVVVGDVNSTVAASLAAAKLGVKIAHIEAGLRSFDRSMPEEINRVLTDRISDYLFTTEESANKNLIREGIEKKKIFFVGNTMIDSRILYKDKISKSQILKRLSIEEREYCIVTMHRPSNVDKKQDLQLLVKTLEDISRYIRVVFPVHPRTKKMLFEYNLSAKGIIMVEPLGYLDFQKLLGSAKFVITDSGGIQEEAAICKVPCLTVRTTTERPITIEKGTNKLVGPDRRIILKSVRTILKGSWKRPLSIPKWDGKAARRVVNILLKKEKAICTQR